MDKFEKFMYGCLVFVFILLFWAISIFVVGSNIRQQCTQAGYPEYAVTWNYEGYCISWINATKVVVPLDKIK